MDQAYALLVSFGWVPLAGIGFAMCRRRSLRRKLAVALPILAVAWTLSLPDGWFLAQPGKPVGAGAPNGRAWAGLVPGWGNRAFMEWRGPDGRAHRLYAGGTATFGGRRFLTAPMLRGGWAPLKLRRFVWFPGSETFYIGLSAVAGRRQLVDVVTGARRRPTREECRWLLSLSTLDESEKEFVRSFRRRE